jgi:hypothetical protein
MNGKLRIPLVIALAAAVVAPALAAGPPGKGGDKPPAAMDIVRKANRVSYYQGADGRANVSMVITDEQGRERTPEMTILRWDQPDPNAKTDADRKKDDHCGEQKFYVYFHRPADVNRMSFLVWKHLKKDDDRWLYLPGLDLVKRISAGDKRTSFVGSHFLYEDVSGRNLEDDKHELVKTTKNYHVIRSTPKKPETVEFAHFETWILRSSFLVRKVDYYDGRGRKYRTYDALAVRKIQGYWTVTKSRMTDLRTKGSTLLTYSGIQYNAGVPEEVFTERYLRQPPRKHLR